MSKKKTKRRGSQETRRAQVVQAGAPRGRKGKRPVPTVLARSNYMLLLLGLALIVVGYVVMRVDNQVESFASLYVAPLMILGGYLEIIWAIFYRPKKSVEND